MGGSSSNDSGGGVDSSTSSSQAGMTGSERTADSEARASRDRPDDNDRGGAREAKETFDRAMDNANRPDRAPASPPETTTVADEGDQGKTDKPDDPPDRAAGPPGIGAPPSSPPENTAAGPESPNDPDNNSENEDGGGLLDSARDVFGGLAKDMQDFAKANPRVDSHGNPRGLIDADGVQHGDVASGLMSSGTSPDDLARQLGFMSPQDMAASQTTDFIDGKYQEQKTAKLVSALEERYGVHPDLPSLLQTAGLMNHFAPPSEEMGATNQVHAEYDQKVAAVDERLAEIDNKLNATLETGPLGPAGQVSPAEARGLMAEARSLVDEKTKLETERNAALRDLPEARTLERMANAELSHYLDANRQKIETLATNELAHIDSSLPGARARRDEVLERYENAANVRYDAFGSPQMTSPFELDGLVEDFRAANAEVAYLENERVAMERALDRPDAIEMGFIAEDTYNDRSHLEGSHLNRLEGDELPAGFDQGLLANERSGFFGAVYENSFTDEIVAAARGTDFGNVFDPVERREFMKDLNADMRQVFGVPSEAYDDAKDFAEEVGENFGDRDLRAAGHSLGGGQAAVTAGVLGIEATTINGASLHDNTMERYGFDREQVEGRVTNHHVSLDPVTTIQRAPGFPDPIGEQRNTPAESVFQGPLGRHSVTTAVQSEIREQERLIDDLSRRQANR